MKKGLLFLLVFAATLPLGSCRRAVERAAEKIRVEAVEKVERQGLTSARVTVRIANGTAHKLVLNAATVDIHYGTGRAASIVLRNEVSIESRTTRSVETEWQVKVSDLLALYALTRKVASDDISQIFVSVTAEGRGGPVPVNISREMMPLSDILNTFGMTLQDVKNYLR